MRYRHPGGLMHYCPPGGLGDGIHGEGHGDGWGSPVRGVFQMEDLVGGDSAGQRRANYHGDGAYGYDGDGMCLSGVRTFSIPELEACPALWAALVARTTSSSTVVMIYNWWSGFRVGNALLAPLHSGTILSIPFWEGT